MIPLIKIRLDLKMIRDSVKINFGGTLRKKNYTCINSKRLCLTMVIRNNSFCFWNFKMLIEASMNLTANAKLQYLFNRLCGEALEHFKNVCL